MVMLCILDLTYNKNIKIFKREDRERNFAVFFDFKKRI